MSMVRIDEAMLYALGFDRVFVDAMRHVVKQVGVETNGVTLPDLATQIYSSVKVLAQTAVPVTMTGTLAETVLATFVLSGGSMGKHGVLRITPIFSCTNSANAKTFKVKLGATAFLNTGVSHFSLIQPLVVIRNRGALNMQVAFNPVGNSGVGMAGGAVALGAIDTSVDQTIAITGKLSSAADSITLEGFTVEVIPKT